MAFASDLEEDDFYVPQNLVDEYLIPAAKSASPLPANANGAALLQARIEALANR